LNHVTLAAFLQLEVGVDFDAVDKQPVDLLFALMVPENSRQEHLDIALLAAMFRNAEFCRKIRETEVCLDKFNLLTGWQAPSVLL